MGSGAQLQKNFGITPLLGSKRGLFFKAYSLRPCFVFTSQYFKIQWLFSIHIIIAVGQQIKLKVSQ